MPAGPAFGQAVLIDGSLAVPLAYQSTYGNSGTPTAPGASGEAPARSDAQREMFVEMNGSDPFGTRPPDGIDPSAVVCVAGCGTGRLVVVYRPDPRSTVFAARAAEHVEARVVAIRLSDSHEANLTLQAASKPQSVATTDRLVCVAGCYGEPQRSLYSVASAAAPEPTVQAFAFATEPRRVQRASKRTFAARIKRAPLTTAAIAVRAGGLRRPGVIGHTESTRRLIRRAG